MSEEQIRRIIDDSYDDSKEEPLRAMARDFYSRRMRSIAILVWGWSILFITLAAYSAIHFFKAEQTQGQIMYAALFVLGAHGVGLMKILGWSMIFQRNITRDLRQTELRIAELSEALRSKK